MNYYILYDFDNYDDLFDFKIKIRNGACFSFLDCLFKYYNYNEDRCLYIQLDSNMHLSATEIEYKLKISRQILSIMLSVPIYEKKTTIFTKDESVYKINYILSNKNNEKMRFVESKVKRFDKSLNFFEEILDLLSTANSCHFKNNIEDGFLYYFKVIEKISKHHYIHYMDRHHKRSNIRSNKNKMNQLIKEFLKTNLSISLTNNMLSTMTDNFYKYLTNEAYGNAYSKIMLMVIHKKIKYFSEELIDGLVKARNKLAHGDLIDEDTLETLTSQCELLALELFSFYFFNINYSAIHIHTERFIGIKDWLI